MQFLEQARGAVGLDSKESLALLRGPPSAKARPEPLFIRVPFAQSLFGK